MNIAQHLICSFISGLIGLAFFSLILTDPPGSAEAFWLAFGVVVCSFLVCIDRTLRVCRALS